MKKASVLSVGWVPSEKSIIRGVCTIGAFFRGCCSWSEAVCFWMGCFLRKRTMGVFCEERTTLYKFTNIQVRGTSKNISIVRQCLINTGVPFTIEQTVRAEIF